MSKMTKMETDEESTQRNEDQVKVAYPKNDESLEEFLHRCQWNKYEVMMHPRCISVFDKKDVENI